MKFVIGIAGLAGAGKDTVADMIIELNRKFAKASFAKPLKDMVKTGLGLSEEQVNGSLKDTVDSTYSVTPRHIMQTLGTEWGRQFVSPDIWLMALHRTLEGPTVIADVRFPNEAEHVRANGVLVHVERPQQLNSVDLSNPALAHSSESGVDIKSGDYTIINDTTMDKLKVRVAVLLRDIETNGDAH